MDKSALKSVVKVESSQDRGPTEPENQFIRTKIIRLLFQALMARNIWEAMEYLMAARGLLQVRPSTLDGNDIVYSSTRLSKSEKHR